MSKRSFVVGKDDRLDRVASEIYGTEQGGTVEALMKANPGLADNALRVPAGTILAVPEFVDTSALDVVRPWI